MAQTTADTQQQLFTCRVAEKAWTLPFVPQCPWLGHGSGTDMKECPDAGVGRRRTAPRLGEQVGSGVEPLKLEKRPGLGRGW